MTPPHLVSVTASPQFAFSSSQVDGQPVELPPPSPSEKLPPVAPLPVSVLASGMNRLSLLTTSGLPQPEATAKAPVTISRTELSHVLMRNSLEQCTDERRGHDLGTIVASVS